MSSSSYLCWCENIPVKTVFNRTHRSCLWQRFLLTVTCKLRSSLGCLEARDHVLLHWLKHRRHAYEQYFLFVRRIKKIKVFFIFWRRNDNIFCITDIVSFAMAADYTRLNSIKTSLANKVCLHKTSWQDFQGVFLFVCCCWVFWGFGVCFFVCCCWGFFFLVWGLFFVCFLGFFFWSFLFDLFLCLLFFLCSST